MYRNEVYRPLHHVKGLTNCLNICKNGLELEYYNKADLEDYTRNNFPPPRIQKLALILQIVVFVAVCHDRKVLWLDIALRNILLADGMAIRAIDFANSAAVPLDADVEAATFDGYKARPDQSGGVARHQCHILHLPQDQNPD